MEVFAAFSLFILPNCFLVPFPSFPFITLSSIKEESCKITNRKKMEGMSLDELIMEVISSSSSDGDFTVYKHRVKVLLENLVLKFDQVQKWAQCQLNLR